MSRRGVLILACLAVALWLDLAGVRADPFANTRAKVPP
jgi:hypothetical protein